MSFRYGSYTSSPYTTPKPENELGFTAPSWQSFYTRSPTSPRALPVSGLANTMSGIALTSSSTLRNANEFQQSPSSPAHPSLGGGGAEAAHHEASSLLGQQRVGGAYTHSGFSSGSYYPEQSSMAGPSSMQDATQQADASSLPSINTLSGELFSPAAHSRNLSMGQQVDAVGVTGSVSTPALSDSAAMSSEFNPSPFGTPGSFASVRRTLPGQSPARYARELPPSQRQMQQSLRHGALCIHQTFPDTGDQGVPVTVLLSVKSDWARDVGLLLMSEGRYGGGRSSNGSQTSAQSRFSVCFGNAEVEARVDRSLSDDTDSSASNFGSLDTSVELELTITAHSPSFMNAHWPSARVPIRLRLISDGEPVLDPMDPLGSTGIDVGEYLYWQISPRETLKRSGDMLEGAADHGALRRPASFPALGSVGNQQRSNLYAAPNKTSSITRTLSGRRSGLGETLGLGRPSAAGPSQLGTRHPRGQFSATSMGQFSEQGPMEDVKSSDGMSGAGFNLSAANQFSSGVAVGFDAMRRNSVHEGGSLADAARQTASSSSQPQSPQRSIASVMPHQQQQGSQDSPAPGTPLIGTDGLPQLMRASQIPAAAGPGSAGSETAASPPPPTARASLELHGNLNDMAVGWSTDEWRGGRRLVQFWRRQEGTTIHAMCKPILPTQYVPNSIVVSCIFREDKNECFITSVDAIYLLEALVASRFTVEEKNRIRRNLEGFRPLTISKSKRDERNAAFFSLIMSFPNPKPRNIEKDVKVFPWKVLAPALKKIIGKYSAAYDPSAGPSMPYVSTSGHMRDDSTGGSSGERSNPTPPTVRDARLAPDGGMSSVDTMVSGSSHSSYGTMAPSMGSSMAYSAPQPPPSQRRDFAYNDFVVSPMAFNEQHLQQQQGEHDHQLPTVQSMPNMHGQINEHQQHFGNQGALDFNPGPHDGFGGR